MSNYHFSHKIDNGEEDNMSFYKNISFRAPAIRIEKRDLNLTFFKDTLGMKLVTEENALAMLSGYLDKNIRFILEESPTYRTRAAKGTKKLKQLIIKANANEIAQLLIRGAKTNRIFKGKNGYAFETTSPQGDNILIHAEDNLEALQVVETVTGDIDQQFKGLSDFTIDQIVLNVPNPDLSHQFYQDTFDGKLPLKLQFEKAEGCDLTVEPQITWDLELLEFKFPADYDLLDLYEHFKSKKLHPYIDRKGSVLVISDPSNIEIWFTK